MKNLYTLLIISFFSMQSSFAQYEGYSSNQWERQLDTEESFGKLIDKTSFKKHLMKLTERPHVVGSEGNEEVIRYIGKTMEDAGFDLSLIHI